MTGICDIIQILPTAAEPQLKLYKAKNNEERTVEMLDDVPLISQQHI